MTAFEDHQSSKACKVLVLGNSGAGKTVLIGSLARAGYRCFILDYDNGLDSLKDPKFLPVEFRKNIKFRTLTDKLKGVPPVPDGFPKAAQDGLDLLSTGWTELKKGPDGKPIIKEPPKPATAKAVGAALPAAVVNLVMPVGLAPMGPVYEMDNLGTPYTWGPNDVLILDSIGLFCEAVMRFVLHINSWSGKTAQVQHWGEAIRIVEGVLQLLYSEQVKCNVVINAHIKFMGDENKGGALMGLPSVLGKELPPKVGRYFNSVLMLDRTNVLTATASMERRVLRTVSAGIVDLKNPVPSRVPAEMEPDLAKFFEIVKSA